MSLYEIIYLILYCCMLFVACLTYKNNKKK